MMYSLTGGQAVQNSAVQVIFIGVVDPCWCPLEGDPIDRLVMLQNLTAGEVGASLSRNPQSYLELKSTLAAVSPLFI